MLKLTICILSEIAAEFRRKDESIQAFLERMQNNQLKLSKTEFQDLYLEPLKVLVFPKGERPQRGFYAHSRILFNGLEILSPRGEPVIFKSTMRNAMMVDSHDHSFPYSGEELVFIVEVKPETTDTPIESIGTKLTMVQNAIVRVQNGLVSVDIVEKYVRDILSGEMPTFRQTDLSKVVYEGLNRTAQQMSDQPTGRRKKLTYDDRSSDRPKLA